MDLNHLKQEPGLVEPVKDSAPAATMEHRADERVKEQLPTEMNIKKEVEEEVARAAHVDIEIDGNHLKQEPGLIQSVKSDPVLLVKEAILKSSSQGTDEQQGVPATSTRAIVDSTSVAVDSTSVAVDSFERGELLHIKEELEDTDLYIGPTVLQHMDSHYGTKQADINGLKQEMVPEEVRSRIDQVENETIEGSLKSKQHQRYRCDKCLKAFKSKLLRNRHCNTIHGTESHKCTQCNKEFKCKSYLARHVRYIHSQKKYECDICKKTFSTPEALHLHVSRFHHNSSTERNYRCDKCMKTFRFECRLKAHSLTMHGTECYKCAECNREFNCMLYLRHHINYMHSNGQYECDICKKKFKSKKSLTRHIVGRHRHLVSDYKVRKNRCDKCMKKFLSKRALKAHSLRLHGTKCYKCAECNKEFKCMLYLRIHINNTHSKKLFECDICKKIFKLKKSRTQHIMECHGHLVSATTMEHGGSEPVMHPSHMEMTMRIDVEAAAPSTTYVENEQGVPATSTCAIVSRTCVAADSVEQDQSLHVKEKLEDPDLDIGPTVLQHMDSHYRTDQINVNHLKQEPVLAQLVKSVPALSVQEESPEYSRQCSRKQPELGMKDSGVCGVLQSFKLEIHIERLESICRVQLTKLNIFQCNLCDAVYTENRFLLQHLQSVHRSRPITSLLGKFPKANKQQRNAAGPKVSNYRCDKCIKTFCDKWRLYKHFEIMHGTEYYKCAECNKEFKCKPYLRRHIDWMHGTGHYECDICKKIFKSKIVANRHISNHMRNMRRLPDPKVNKYHCDKCMKTFKLKKSLKRHCQNTHEAEYCKCPECNKEYKCMSYLRNHINKVHSNKEYEFDICKKILKSKETVSHHIYNCHSRMLPDPKDNNKHCDKCMKTFKSKFILKRHCQYMHGTDYYKCVECSREFKCMSYLREHINDVHSKKQYECDICKRIAKTKKAVRRHIFKCHMPGSRNYTCVHCKKSFKKKAVLKKHIEGVHRERIHRCSKCSRTFKSRRNLKLHKTRLHGKRQHDCEVCHKIFTAKYLLREHVKKVHGSDDIESKSDLHSQDVHYPRSIAGDTTAMVGTGTQQHGVVNVKSEPVDADLELGPVVFQHMDSNYRPYKEETQCD